MKSAIIDVGSNSVRLLYNGQKYTNTTQLAEGLMNTKRLSIDAMNRTILAIEQFRSFAKSNGADKVYVFATEAVRSAQNKDDFLLRLRERGIIVDLVSPAKEGQYGFYGAYEKGTIATLDIGGASSEIAVGNENGIIYTYSLPVGSVRLKDYSTDFKEQMKYMKKLVENYGDVPKFDTLVGIGGSTSTLYATMLGMEPYDTNKVHLSKFTYKDIKKTIKMINDVPVEERINIKGLHPKKTLVAPAGGVIALAIMDYLKKDYMILSEKDNLEGYAKLNNIEI